MAYNLSNRFQSPEKYYALRDPGTYHIGKAKPKPNKAPFLSRTSRKTINVLLWTQATYDTNLPHKINNITAFKSKVKRFPHEEFTEEDLEEMLCRCGIAPCECPVSETVQVPEVVCQGKIKRHLIKGREHTPIPKKPYHCPPFYDVRVIEASAFYHGCKWSQRFGKRRSQSIDDRPGPAHYSIERKPTYNEICAEKFRELKRKQSRQLRFIDSVQNQIMLDGFPGPATYIPSLSKGPELQYFGPKAERFPEIKQEIRPGPADHWIRRDFDLAAPPERFCGAILPHPAGFGGKADRWIVKRDEGPSPASYSVNTKFCNFLHCPTTPFNSSEVRFKADIIEESDDESIVDEDSKVAKPSCPTPTWPFKSTVVRMKPLVKESNGDRLHELPIKKDKGRSLRLQYIAPFNSSEGRFRAWYNDIPTVSNLKNLGPGTYSSEQPKYLPAVNYGPLCRTPRFPAKKLITPAPNEYNVKSGMMVETHNQRLKNNIENQHRFTWEPPNAPVFLSLEEKEKRILQKCIHALEPDFCLDLRSSQSTTASPSTHAVEITNKEEEEVLDKPKMLRTFLYSHPI